MKLDTKVCLFRIRYITVYGKREKFRIGSGTQNVHTQIFVLYSPARTVTSSHSNVRRSIILQDTYILYCAIYVRTRMLNGTVRISFQLSVCASINRPNNIDGTYLRYHVGPLHQLLCGAFALVTAELPYSANANTKKLIWQKVMNISLPQDYISLSTETVAEYTTMALSKRTTLSFSSANQQSIR